MAIEIVPEWMTNLDDEDVAFIKNLFFPLDHLKKLLSYTA